MKQKVVSLNVLLISLFFLNNVFAAAELTGQFVQGGLLFGLIEPGTQIKLDGKDVKVTKDGQFIIGFGRDAKLQSQLLMVKNGIATTQTIEVAKREYDIQKINGVPQRTVNPKEEDLIRIRKETALIKKARSIITDHTYFLENFQWPLLGRISGVYGSQRVYNGEPRRPHYGIDIAAPTGTIVNAPISGVVTLVHDDMFFSGGTLIVDHGYGLSSTFIHLSESLVEKGQVVKQGDPIAKVGASGRATGPHLDWRMNWYKQRIDPALLVEPMPQQSASKP